MCLDTIFRGKKKREALAKLPDSGYYWKVVMDYGNKYRGCCECVVFENGWNVTKAEFDRRYGYELGYHLFRHEKEARGSWLSGKRIRCKVEKKDIVAIGTQNALCIVTTRFWCPKPKGAQRYEQKRNPSKN